LHGAKKAIVAVTCGTNVSLYEAQHTVDWIIETSGSNNIDIKFGVALNDLLEDSILVSVIASDFEEKFDFTKVPTPMLSRPLIPDESDVTVKSSLDKDDDLDILPDFLKGVLEED
ncbi:MAG TPA: cell division protein FtsZ, partial [Bacilli bacterium]|nr:cell division protein FtsZ [Bacilli bacterium]